MPAKSPRRKIRAHAIAWACFIFYEVSIALVLNPSGTLWWEYAGYYSLNILLFYFNAHVVFSRAFGARKALCLLALLVPLELGLYTAAEFGLQHLMNLFRAQADPVRVDLEFLARYLWRGIYFIGLSTAYWLVLRTMESSGRINRMAVGQAVAAREKAELEKDLAQAQSSFLRAQINPHLLFNTLNFIYNAVQDVSPKASEGVLLLSGVMQYALGQGQEDGKTDLSEEVAQIRKYVSLNQLRFSRPLQLRLQLEGAFSQDRFPPLVLLTLVENIFKHGVLHDPAHPATVSIRCSGHRLHFLASNSKRTSPLGKERGMGIRNIETRLGSLYREEDFRLRIQEDEQSYSVDLQVKLA